MPPLALPKAPKHLTALPTSPTRIALAWVDRANNEHRYVIEWAEGPTGAFDHATSLGPNQQTHTVGELVPDMRYTFRVRAENAQGVSPWSNLVEAQTPEAPNQGPVVDLQLSVPPELRVAMPIEIDLRGSYDPDGEIVRGDVQWGDGQATTWDGAPGVLAHDYAEAGDYEIVVTAEDEDGMRGSLSASLTVMPPVALPPPDPVPLPVPDPPPPPPPPDPPPPPPPIPTPVPTGPGASPTGYDPRFYWTPTRQGYYNQMRADYQANIANPATLGGVWYKLIKTNADVGNRYGDSGLWATLMYQFTGDASYVEKAWAKIEVFLNKPVAETKGNYIREHGGQHVQMLDWLWPGLTAARRDLYKARIEAMLDYGLHVPASGLRLNDSDQVTGTYFAVAMYAVRFPENALAQQLLAEVGGLTPTATDFSTARNAIKTYCTVLAEGGEWCESGEYNMGTLKLLFLGAEAIKTATGVDHFPEITALLPHVAEHMLHYWDPSLTAIYQWGDEQDPHVAIKYPWTHLYGTLSGLLQGTTVGQQTHQILLDLIAKYGAVGFNTMEPAIFARTFLVFNPYAPSQEWRTSRTHHARGMGVRLHRSGFALTDSLFAVHGGNRPQGRTVDHYVQWLQDFELWRQNEWALTHPRAYGNAPNTGRGVNAVLMHSFSSAATFKDLVGYQADTDYAYQASTTGGSMYSQPYYNPPPVFCHEWTRSVLYVPGTTDTIIIFDRAHLDPVVARLDRYRTADQTRMAASIHPKLWNLHMRPLPTIAADVRWTTAGGQAVRWTPMLPTVRSLVLVDERALAAAGTSGWANIVPSELGYHVLLHPGPVQAWDTFLNVLQVGTAGTPTLVQQAGEVEGVAVPRSGQADVVAIFNAKPGPRLAAPAFDPSHLTVLPTVHLRNTGYTVSGIPVVGATALVFLCDLDPAKAWTVRIDGAAPVALAVSSQGVARLTLTGAGAHTLVVA